MMKMFIFRYYAFGKINNDSSTIAVFAENKTEAKKKLSRLYPFIEFLTESASETKREPSNTQGWFFHKEFDPTENIGVISLDLDSPRIFYRA